MNSFALVAPLMMLGMATASAFEVPPQTAPPVTVTLDAHDLQLTYALFDIAGKQCGMNCVDVIAQLWQKISTPQQVAPTK